MATKPSQLDLLKSTFGLSDGELAPLLHIEAHEVQRWRDHGIPEERAAHVDRILAFVKLMLRRLSPDRIAVIVRTPAKGLRGGTMLDELRVGHEAELLEYLERLETYPNT